MKHLLNFTCVLGLACMFMACKNQSVSLFSKPHSALVDSLHFKDAGIADIATNVDIITKEQLKLDREWDKYSAADRDTIIKKLHEEVIKLRPKIDSVAKKFGIVMEKTSTKTTPTIQSPEMDEFVKWLKFAQVEAKETLSIKHTSLQF